MPIRPRSRMSPSPATPSASAERISGITSMKSSRRKIAPIGSAIRTATSSAGDSPSSRCPAIPSTPPMPRPASMPNAECARTALLAPGLDEDLRVLLRRAQVAERLRDAADADLAGHERGDVDAAVGERAQRVHELERRVAEHELEGEL